MIISTASANDEKSAKNAAKGDEYRRSSLCLVLAKDKSIPNAEVIEESFLGSQMPDKYNDHNVGVRTFAIDDITTTDADYDLFKEAVEMGILAEKTEKSGGELPEGAIMPTVTIDPSDKKTQMATLAYKYLRDNDFPQQMAANWFGGVSENTPEIVWNRGLYDASAQRIDEAAASLFGTSSLKEAGMQLIPKTFTVVSRYEYLSKDELIEQIGGVMLLAAELSGENIAIMAAKAAITTMKATMGDGYYVKTTSFLFQLDWNDDMLTLVDTKLWNNPAEWEANKSSFKIKYIGSETAWAKTKAGIFTNKPESELIRIATVDAMDNVLAKLEKRYEVFKTKVPLMVAESGEGKKIEQLLTAKVGMKEGLSGGEKFEVLEAMYDEATNQHKYKRIGVVKVDKKHIWDNRYMAAEESEATGTTQEFAETRFDGGKNKFYSGCLLRQIR
ncbi:MAG: hypothetical protein R3Y68_07790 [Rikenellaceae bacterium]